jgi:hypothetical protein
VLIDYICRVTGGMLCAGDDVCRVEWVKPEGLQNFEITEGTLGVIEKAFRKRRRYKKAPVEQPLPDGRGSDHDAHGSDQSRDR